MVSPEDIPANQPNTSRNAKRSTAPPAESAEALVVVTLRASDGSILKIEAVEPDATRHELSPAEAARLLGDGPKATVEGLVHEAFEAGIAYVLDDNRSGAATDEASGESQEETALHDELLDSLIARSAAKRILQREILNSALLGTIISEAAAPEPTAAG